MELTVALSQKCEFTIGSLKHIIGQCVQRNLRKSRSVLTSPSQELSLAFYIRVCKSESNMTSDFQKPYDLANHKSWYLECF